MSEILTLKDIYQVTSQEVRDLFGDNIQALLLFGSFASQNLEKRIDEFKELQGKQGALDKKPDYIVVVDNITNALASFIDLLEWDEGTFHDQLALTGPTPNYYNLETKKRHRFDFWFDAEYSKIPFRVSLISKDNFTKKHRYYDFYLPGRLSKPLNIVDVKPSFQIEFDQVINKTIENTIDLTLLLLPDRFSGRHFIKKYVELSYLSEWYRIFDIYKGKPMTIIKSKLFNTKTGEYKPMITLLHEMLIPRLKKRPEIAKIFPHNNFHYQIFENLAKDKLDVPEALARLAACNVYNAQNSFYKNWRTQSASGQSALKYVARKFGITISNTPQA